jgi:dTDP-4-dehydrorhamnose reductase
VELDVSEGEAVGQVIEEKRPDVVIHCAAATAVDRCERDPAWAELVNVVGTENVAEACAGVGARLVCVSTDHVFDGEKGEYSEGDMPNPVNVYGRSKLEGEKRAIAHCSNTAITRTSANFGWHPTRQSFATWVIESLRTGRPIQAASDNYNSPTLVDFAAQHVLAVAESDFVGVLHLGGPERVSRYEFAVKIAEAFSLNPTPISPVRMAELTNWIARRPPDSSLMVEKARNELGLEFRPLSNALSTMRKTITSTM